MPRHWLLPPGTAPTNLDSGPAVPPVGANNLDGEVGAAPVPPAPTPEPIDPAQVVEDVHQNLEPDIAAGQSMIPQADSSVLLRQALYALGLSVAMVLCSGWYQYTHAVL